MGFHSIVGFLLPQRGLLALMAFLGFMCEYMMRNLLSIAITQIAKKNIVNESVILGEVCQIEINESFVDIDEIDMAEGTYEWNEAVQGVILSSFYWGYIITHLPSAMLVEKIGGKIVLLAGIFSSSILTSLTPLSITIGGSTLLIINRILLGLCQGVIYASVFGLLSTWIPLKERTTLGVFVLSGIQVKFLKQKGGFKILIFQFGSILSSYLSGVLLQKLDGWEWPFYIYSIIGVVWCIGFVCSYFHFQITCSF